MKAETTVKNGTGEITIIDKTGKHAPFTMVVDERDVVKLKHLGDREAKRVEDLYDNYDKIKFLLGKKLDMKKAVA